MSFIRKIKKGNKTYLAEVESIRIKDKVVQRFIRYIGKEADGKTILSASISNISIEQVKLHGPLLVLNQIAKEINLHALLGDYAKEILCLIYAHCLDYKSINQMPQWFERTDLNFLLDLENVTETKLLKALDSLESKNANGIQKKIFNSVKKKYKLNCSGIVYDVTNTYLYGKKCPFAKLGKDKEGVKGRPLIQIGLGVTKKDGIPIFHKIFNGNTHDSRTFDDISTSFKDYNIKNGLVIYDRGIHSKKNQVNIGFLKWKVLCGLILNTVLKKIIRKEKSNKNFIQFNNRIKLNKSIFYVIAKPYKIAGVKGKILICFNEQQKKDLKESRYDEISYAQLLLKQKKKIKPGIRKYFNAKGNLLLDKVQQDEEFDGFSILFTTAMLSKEEMIKMYFEKDLVEKAFQSLKGITNVRPIRHWLYNRVTAHVFICYLSYLLLSLLKIKLTKLNLSPVTALRELGSLYNVYINDTKKGFKLSKTVALNRKQEKILKSIDKNLLSKM